MDKFMQAAIDEARQGLAEGGIPIGSVLVHNGQIIGRGHNRRVQQGSAIRHGEMDALENAGRQSAQTYRESVLYTTLSPCAMCSGAILLYGIPKVIIGENQTFLGEEALLGDQPLAYRRIGVGVQRGKTTELTRFELGEQRHADATEVARQAFSARLNALEFLMLAHKTVTECLHIQLRQRRQRWRLG